MRLDLATIIKDPLWLPYHYDVQRGGLAFAHVTREQRDRAVFFDHRYLQNPQLTPLIGIDALPADRLAEAAGPLHFIFHTAFCCSTLLVRALEQPGVASALPEPLVLMAFGTPWQQIGQLPAHRRALSAVLDLLSRPLAAGESQIVKPSNIANLLAPDLMALHPQAKAILLYSDLEDYLLAIARRGAAGAKFAHTTFRQFHARAPLGAPLTETGDTQPDLRVAAQGWLKQIAIFEEMTRTFGPRVRTLNSASFLDHKAETLQRAAALFDLPDADWLSVANGPRFTTHAKQPGESFSADAQAAAQNATRQAQSAELADALAFARALAAGQDLPRTLGDTLLETPA